MIFYKSLIQLSANLSQHIILIIFFTNHFGWVFFHLDNYKNKVSKTLKRTERQRSTNSHKEKALTFVKERVGTKASCRKEERLSLVYLVVQLQAC